MSTQYLTEAEVAKVLGVCQRTLQGWRLQRRVLPFTRIGRVVRYPAAAVEKYLTENTVAVDAPQAA